MFLFWIRDSEGKAGDVEDVGTVAGVLVPAVLLHGGPLEGLPDSMLFF